MTIVGATISSRDALKRLQWIKPNDGWSIEIKTTPSGNKEEFRLCRRGVPLTDHFFLDVHHYLKTNSVVGILDKKGETCQLLVDGKTARPVFEKNVQYVSCANSYQGYQPLTASERTVPSANREGRGSVSSGSSNRTNPGPNRAGAARASANNNADAAFPNPFENLSEEEKQLYMKYATIGIGALVAYKVVANIMGEGLLFFLVLPGLYVYGLQSCPDNSTFDAKKEVKRVLRGHHLPDDHPAKPRRGNFLEEWTAKISASVATEVSAATGGYSVEIAPLLGGVAKHAIVTLPTLSLTCEWIGCNDTWYHYRTYTQGGH